MMKWLDLAVATSWILLVVGLPIYLLLPSKETAGEPVTPVFVNAGTNDDMRIELRAKQTNDSRTFATIGAKKDGLAKIAATKTLEELKTQLVENITIHEPSSSKGSIQTNR